MGGAGRAVAGSYEMIWNEMFFFSTVTNMAKFTKFFIIIWLWLDIFRRFYNRIWVAQLARLCIRNEMFFSTVTNGDVYMFTKFVIIIWLYGYVFDEEDTIFMINYQGLSKS